MNLIHKRPTLHLSIRCYQCLYHVISFARNPLFQVAALVTLVLIIVINLAVGILPHMDNFAHIGGFSSGFLLGFVFLIRPQFGWVNQRYAPADSPAPPSPKFKTYQCVLWLVSLILLIVW